MKQFGLKNIKYQSSHVLFLLYSYSIHCKVYTIHLFPKSTILSFSFCLLTVPVISDYIMSKEGHVRSYGHFHNVSILAEPQNYR